MKTALTIASLLGATQCLPPEPSGAGPRPAVSVGSTAAQAAPDAGARPVVDTAWLEPGPPPFTVPTQLMAVDGAGVTLRVPRGAQARGAEAGVLVAVGEGRNYAMLVSADAVALGDMADRVGSELVDGPAREDGAVVWQDAGAWRFEVRGVLTCWNPEGSRHGADDVEMMIASCLSAEETK